MFAIKRLLFLHLLLLFVPVIWACPAQANVKLPSIISDNMVLQRDKPIKIWGSADPGEIIGIKFGEQAAVATADGAGKWWAILKPVPAGGPFEMTIHGKNEVVIRNILVGEVWLCAGQSNIIVPYKSTDFTEQTTADANNDNIRLFKINRDEVNSMPIADPNVQWKSCSKGTFEDFSGLGIFFALDLYKALNIPIGIVEAAHGGATIDTFVSRNSIDTSNEFKSLGTKSDNAYKPYFDAYAKYQKDLDDWNASGKKTAQPVEPEKPPTKLVSGLFNAFIAPIVPYTFRGIVFYQGEADVMLSTIRYHKLFALMVQDWRKHFKNSLLPILYVQLPNFGKRQKGPEDSPWAVMREVQAMCRRIPYAYMVVSLDTGSGADVGIHAKEKRVIASRLAAAALATQHKVSKPFASPIYDGMEVVGSKIRVRFRYADKGLISKSQPVRGFEIAGEDRKFIPAQAQVDGAAVVVASPKIANPVAVRYGWADNPDVNLYSADKLPVSPFRTDDWPRLVPRKTY